MGSAYNPKSRSPEDVQDQSESREERLRCKARNCPLPGSVAIEGGVFCCVHHAKHPQTHWPAITERLTKLKRVHAIQLAARRLAPEAYDKIQERGTWKISSKLTPTKNEVYSHWLHRVIFATHEYLKQQVQDAVDNDTVAGHVNARSCHQAIQDLTSGVLLKEALK